MKCTNCGREVDDGKVFCPSCGKEIQMVPDYNAFEDDFLRELMEEEKAAKMAAEAAAQKKELENNKKIDQAKKKKIIMFSSIGIAVVLLIAAIFIAFAVKRANNSKSFDYQYSKGHEAYLKQDYRDAIEYLEKAIRIDAKVIAQEELLHCYMKIGTTDDINSAILLCYDIIEKDSSNKYAYESLIKILDDRDELDEIVKLSKNVTDVKILALFDNYLVTAPVFSAKGGNYDNVLNLQIAASSNYQIYYTTDGTDPKRYGTLYSSEIVIEKSGKVTIKAICKNDKGLYSEVVSEVYEITISAPDMPVVTPDGGSDFTADSLISIEVPEDCIAYYTWDGSTPTVGASSTFVYEAPFHVIEGNNILTVVIYNKKLNMESPIYRGNFVYYAE